MLAGAILLRRFLGGRTTATLAM